jgi:hypothetical protein
MSDCVAGDGLMAAAGEQPDQVSFEIDTLGYILVVASSQALDIGSNTGFGLRIDWRIAQQKVGLEPAFAQPRRAEPAVHDCHRLCLQHAGVDRRHRGIPLPHLVLWCPSRAAGPKLLRGSREVGVVEVIAVERRHWIRVENKVPTLPGQLVDCSRRHSARITRRARRDRDDDK